MVFNECETLSLVLRQKHRLRVSEKWMLRRMFRLKMDEVTEGSRKFHNR
jgi:hypothetical protein